MDIIKAYGKQTFASLKIRNYRLYFIGQAISLSGTWMQIIAQSWLVLKITGSGAALGFVVALQFLPILLLGPMAGVIIDRVPKRKLLYHTQTAAGMLALTLGILVINDVVRLWMVEVLALCLGIVNAFDNPTRQTFVQEMVSKEKLANAVSLNSTQVNLARAIGPAIAGILITTVGLAFCFLVNAASFAATLVALFMMRGSELHTTLPAPRAKGQMREGFRYVRSNPVLINTLLMMALVGTFAYEFIVSLPLFAKFTFLGDATTYAAMNTAMGVGSIVGALISANRKKTSSRELMKAALYFGAAILVAAITPNIMLAMAALVFVGVFSINFLSLSNIILQLESAPEMRGRVMALWSVAFLGSTPIGGPIIGWIGENIGPRWGLATGGIAALAAAGLCAFAFKKGETQAIPESVETEAETKVEEDVRIR